VTFHESPPVRVFLFKREYTDAFDLRRAIGRSFRRSLLNVLDWNHDGLRTACAVVRANHQPPGLVLVEQEPCGAGTIEQLRLIRELPEFCSLPLIVLGDDADSRAVQRAYENGADGFVALPRNGADLSKVGGAVAKLWNHLQLAQSA
jgi:DNA-binding NarL/FixJ family response regulator